MFYSQFILAKKGPLGTIWIAAHLERKLRKNQVADTDIGVSVDSILFPEVPIALRLSSHLLLGVVRIYSRKVNYLFDDCSEALLKVKQAFRSTAVDLPPEESTAPYHSITLPETFDLDDFELPDNDIFQGNYVDRHVSTREQITLQDTLDGMAYKTTQFGLDERFGDGDASQIGLDLDEVMLIDKDSTLEHNDFSANPQVSRQEDEKKEDVVTTSDKMLVEDSGSKVMLIDQDANLEPDDLGANSQISHHKDEKKEDVIGTSNRMQVEDSGSKIDLSDGFPTSPEFHEYAQGLSTSPEFHDYAQDPSTSPEFHNCAQDPSVSPEFHEYAQGPSTPGLQEPNLFGTQSDQVINEADFHNSADLLSMYSTQNESRAHQTENNVIGCSLQNNGKHVGVDLHHEASDCVLADVNNKREEQEHFTRTVVMKDQGNLIPNNNCLASVPLMDSSNEDHTTTVLPECAGGYVDTSGILEKVERLHDGVLMNTESVMANLNETVNVVSGGVNINDSGVSPSCSHVTSDQEGLSCKLLSNMDESRGSEFGGHLADVTTLLKHGVSNNSEVSKNEQQPSVAYEAQVSNIVSPLESSGRPEVVDVEARASQELKEAGILNFVSHEAEQPTQSHLRPCTSRVNNPSLLSIEGEKCHETDVSDPALGYHGTVEPSACEGKLDLGQSGMQFGSQIISNKMGSVNTFTASDIPEPESMLSLGQSGMQFGSQIISNKMGSVNTFTASDIPEPEKMLSLGQSGMQFGNQMISNKMGSVNTFTATDIPEPEKMLSLGQSGMQFGNQMISHKMGSINTFTDIPAPEKMLSLGQSDMQYGSQMIGNKMGSVNTFTASNIPEPEKMLSLAYPHFGEMNHLLLESTPGNQVISGGHRDVAAVTSISGQKRSYTESTLTLQSMGLVESYGGAQSRRTTGSIPDDNDLLSSILAGRKSSALKVKPSPATAEVPTAKRFRSTPRTSTLKRKVLVDDTMVLHGDTIRHQLISTEDIRRVRKKAPCTSDEILMIQRQVLEDKIFHKPIFTDLSADLTILQNGAFDLSGIKVYDYGLDGFSVEKVNNQQSYSKSNAEIHVGQAHNEPMAVQPQEEAEESYSKTNVGIHEVESHNEPMEVQLQNNAEAQPSEMPVPSERESHNETMEVQPQITAEAQPSEMPVPSEREPHNETMEVQPQITAEARPSEMPVPSERESHNETMEVQPQITAEAQPSEMPVPSERESHNETMEVQPQITAEAQPSEIPLQLESDQSGVDFGSHDIDAHGRANIISNMKELSGSQNAEMNNAGGIFEISETENYSVGPTNIISDVNELGSSQNAEMNNAGRIFETSEAENYSIVHSNIISDVNELGGSQNAEMNNAGRNFETSEAENYSIVHSNIISDGNELGSSQNAEMSNSGGNFETFESENYSVVPGHETLSLTEVFENELCMPKDFDASQPLMDKTDDGAGSIQTNVLEIPTSEKMNTSTILENEFVDDQHDRNNADAIEIAEHDMEIGTRVETDGLEADNLHASLVLGSKEASEYTDNQVSFHGDLPMEENGNNMLEGLNEDLVVSSGLGCDDKDAKAGGLFSENIEVDCLHSVAPEDVKEGSNDEENSVFQEAALQNTMYPDVSAIRSPSVDQNDEDDMVDNDTGFLNVGDDEIIDDDDDDADGFAPGAEGTQLENSGWSSRTRAVAKYLQTLFDKEDLHGRQSLHLDKILVGKTRKEASRMFFETLVLKTRDYIDVEQTKPFANINLQPRGKLMKTDF
ncbi:sister chromatid cohesion 1 protein 4 isoform X30 [Lathyrus oleraceus]|uniref:sister chromatid cohesion 1 protein 4 isoform X30 n=1 Tax=Pisum sativum TaxID=3888 RepID=UPI0021D18322|nr:sister chromatid cohesion 1 protein 4 isoform X30 [Pisum sativum]